MTVGCQKVSFGNKKKAGSLAAQLTTWHIHWCHWFHYNLNNLWAIICSSINFITMHLQAIRRSEAEGLAFILIISYLIMQSCWGTYGINQCLAVMKMLCSRNWVKARCFPDPVHIIKQSWAMTWLVLWRCMGLFVEFIWHLQVSTLWHVII